MNTYKFNIGLNNNPFTFEQVRDHVESVFGAEDIREMLGSWEHHEEPTVVFTLKAHSAMMAHVIAQELCQWYGQAAIPFADVNTGRGELVYRRDWVGEEVEFNHDYFID